MSKVNRTDEFAIAEKGPEWLNNFLRTFSGAKTGGYQDLLDIINDTAHKSIENLVKSYREQCGLDLVNFEEDDIIKEASALVPIAPMKLKKIENLDDVLKNHNPEGLIVQVKFDGWKTQAIKTNGKVDLFTRRGEKFTENVPELIDQLNKSMGDDSFLLGELVWEDKNGKQSISDIQTVAGSSPEKAHEKIKSGNGKVIFYVYDILWENNKDITGQKYINRYNILVKTIGKKSNIQVVDNYTWPEKEKAMKDAANMGGEGIVIKPKDSAYKYAKQGQNEPVGEWYKYKKGVKSNTDEVILNKYHKDTSKLIFPAYQYKDGDLFEVGQLSGMPKEDEAKIKKDIDAGKNAVVEVTFQERMSSGKFRHMGWSRLRPEKPAKEVKMANFRPLSIRHAEEKQDVVTIITNSPELKSAIDSFVEHSGGNKSTHSIIQFLREKLGNDIIKFTDRSLIDYIENKKKESKSLSVDDYLDIGRVGIDKDDQYEDDVADYVTHSNVK
ncbi:MAG: RNA ligase family protein [Patescibacteria group bacterium]